MTNGSFYRSASSSMLASSKPWVNGISSTFSSGFDGSGMFRDTRIDSLMKERERQKAEAENRRKKLCKKSSFSMAALNIGRQAPKKTRRRERKCERHAIHAKHQYCYKVEAIIIAKNRAT